MAYCDREDIIRELGGQTLIELTSDSDTIEWGVVDKAILRASSLIDSYLARRYTVPLENPPEVIEDAAIVITTYFLYAKRAHSAAAEVPADLKERYQQVISWLKDLAAGKAEIDIDAGGTGDGNLSAGGVGYSTQTRVFDENFEEAF